MLIIVSCYERDASLRIRLDLIYAHFELEKIDWQKKLPINLNQTVRNCLYERYLNSNSKERKVELKNNLNAFEDESRLILPKILEETFQWVSITNENSRSDVFRGIEDPSFAITLPYILIDKNETNRVVSFEYELPTMPQAMRFWILCFSYYWLLLKISIEFSNGTSYLDGGFTLEDIQLTYEGYLSNGHVSGKLFSEICSTVTKKNLSLYELSCTNNQFFRNFFFFDLIDFLNADKKVSILWNEFAQMITNQDILHQEKIKNILTFIKNYFKSNSPTSYQHEFNKRKELTYLFASINQFAIHKLFRQCLNKEAHDGGKYSWNYTEWNVLRHAQFNLRKDGLMSVKMTGNRGYHDHYAAGKANEDKLIKEMEYLASLIGFEFDPSTNFHTEWVFTRSCTESLMHQGLHFHADYIKTLVGIKNKALIILRDQSRFFHPPKEIIIDICNESYSNSVTIAKEEVVALNTEIKNI